MDLSDWVGVIGLSLENWEKVLRECARLPFHFLPSLFGSEYDPGVAAQTLVVHDPSSRLRSDT